MMPATAASVKSTTVMSAAIKSAMMRTAGIVVMVTVMMRRTVRRRLMMRGVRTARIAKQPKPHPARTIACLLATTTSETSRAYQRNKHSCKDYDKYNNDDECIHKLSLPNRIINPQFACDITGSFSLGPLSNLPPDL
jgi:hypothetical protein